MDMTKSELDSAKAERAAGKKSMMSGIAGIGKGILGLSDKRTKENILQIGMSPSGIPIYSFNYKGYKQSWSGAIAQDLLDLNRVLEILTDLHS